MRFTNDSSSRATLIASNYRVQSQPQSTTQTELQIELSPGTLCRLLETNQITLSEIRCLNSSTKCEIQKCLLEALRSRECVRYE